MKKAFVTTISLMLCILFLISGCGPKANDEPIVVGLVAALSGNSASAGESIVRGAELAVEQVNAAGGINGRPIKLVKEDDENTPAKSVSAVNKLISNDKVIAIIGTNNSSCTLADMQVTQAAELPHICPAASNVKITSSGNPWIVNMNASDKHQASAAVLYAIDKLGAERIALMYQSDDYGIGGKEVIEATLQERGMQLVAAEAFESAATDMNAQLLNIKKGDPQVLLLWTMHQPAALICRQARQLGMKDVQFIGGGGTSNSMLYELGKEAAEGFLNTQTFLADESSASPAAQQYIKDFKAKYDGLLPDSNSAQAYDCVMILADALKQASPDLKNTDIMQNLKSIKDRVCVTGNISFDEGGAAVRDILLVRTKVGGGYEIAN